MKTITLHIPINYDQLHSHLQQNLNPLFQQQRQSDIEFLVEREGDAIEISEPDLYAGFLFRIEISGNELHITRSEHYVDDVNSLTVESILNDLFEDLSEGNGTEIVQEG